MLAKQLWGLAVALLVLLPGALCMGLGSPPGRGFAVEAAVAAGYVGLVLFVLQFALTGRLGRRASPLDMDETMRLHRWLGVLAAALVLAHPVVLLTTEPAFWSFLDPRANWPRALALPAGMVALALLVALPFLRERLGLDHGWWRLTHGLLALFVVAVGTAHVLLVGHHTNAPWKQALLVLTALTAFALWAEVRLLRPHRQRRRPWRVAGVEHAGERTWELALEAEGHDGLTFRPGQFAWLTVAESPYALEQHPFSFASGAGSPRHLSFAIKELGDFTRTVGRIRPGSRAYVDGPYGSFDLPDDPAEPILLLAGGIGIAPLLSMLRTLAARGERRDLVLVYGADRQATLVFHDELVVLCDAVGARYVPVLENPAPAWSGERGRVDRELLERHLPAGWLPRARAFACGPGPMLTALDSLLRELGHPPSKLAAEHFDVL